MQGLIFILSCENAQAIDHLLIQVFSLLDSPVKGLRDRIPAAASSSISELSIRTNYKFSRISKE